ncbi:uncharacterized protein B0T15DRAFT_528302 [Chaetomium strumarium]|uniref:Uncharacterized protein n=1 Tax=Chaetomium strumarium TaxID=1170767 RepID=A0AAJ0GVE7_9PEZI|nr:hypothetical protein B0T15DRAFT_528302 [Chaetomium strumarium]
MTTILRTFGVRNTAPQTQYPNNTVSPSTSNTAGWMVAAIVGSIILFGAALTYVIVQIARHRQYRRQRRLYPHLTQDDILRRRKLSAAELFREEEARRIRMIRKSLATRSTDSAGSKYSAMMARVDEELMEIERQESLRLKDDWKRWEARVRQERSLTADQHPAASAASPVPILTIPSPAKHRSQSRRPPLNPNTAPAALPSNPNRAGN